jgi:hypothetical protein
MYDPAVSQFFHPWTWRILAHGYSGEDVLCGKLLTTGSEVLASQPQMTNDGGAVVSTSSSRCLYLLTNISKVGCDDEFNECVLGLILMLREPRMATMRAKCLKSWIERSITLSKIRTGSISNVALAFADAHMRL